MKLKRFVKWEAPLNVQPFFLHSNSDMGPWTKVARALAVREGLRGMLVRQGVKMEDLLDLGPRWCRGHNPKIVPAIIVREKTRVRAEIGETIFFGSAGMTSPKKFTGLSAYLVLPDDAVGGTE